MTVKNYVLDINKTSLQHPSIVLREDDYNIYTVNISVTDNGTPVDLGSYTLNFLGITPAGAKIIDSENFITTPADLAVGKFSYKFPKEAAGSKGVYDVAYFRLKTTSGATSTIDLNLRVLGGIDLTADEVKDYITVDDILLNTLVAEVFKKVDAKVDDHLATVKKGDKGDTGPAGKDGYMPIIGGRNLYITSTQVAGYVAGTDGTIAPQAGDKEMASDYIAVLPNTEYTFQAWGSLLSGQTYWAAIGQYDSNKSFLNRSVVISGGVATTDMPNDYEKITFTTSANTYFLRVSSRTYGNYRVKFEKGNVPTDWTPAPEDAPSGLSIGGRNYLSNSSGDNLSGWTNLDSLWSVTSDDTRGNVFTATPLETWSSGGVNSIFQTLDKKLTGKQVTVSLWAKASIDGTNFHSEPDGGGNRLDTKLTTSWARYSYTIASFTGTIYFMAVDDGTTYYLDDIQLEIGNVPTDWTPALKDAPSNDAQLVHKTNNETIAGNKSLVGNTALATTTILAGNYGLRVTSSGVQKTTDGKTWVSANI